MIILLFFAFVSGLVTILAPCIWPLLPIILSSTATGGKRKPLGITLGIITSFAFFTLTISYVVKIIPFDPDVLRLFAVIVIGFLGLTLIVPALARYVEGAVSRLSSKMQPVISTAGQSEGFGSGLVTGLALGIVWSPCAGPILATIATLAATRSVNAEIILVTVVYVIGVGIPLFFFAVAGQRFFTKSRFVSRYTGRIQQVFGIIMILTALAIFTNYDKIIQAKLLDAFPAYSDFLFKLEGSKSVKEKLEELKQQKKPQNFLFNNLRDLGKAPEFTGIYKWLNVEKPLAMRELQGKVVLIDFWTYTCINCIRTLPHVTRWHEKYKDKGLVVVGVHTPEFEFEKKTENVLNAMEQYNITYPVAQDNDYETWNAYRNLYWPAKYLIDAKGNIRYTHFGEGKYEETEEAIVKLLEEAGYDVSGANGKEMPKDETPFGIQTPETYLGSARMERFASNERVKGGVQFFSLPQSTPLHYFGFQGQWDVQGEYSASKKDGVLEIHFYAKDVFLVITPARKGDTIKVLLDGKLIEAGSAGKDVQNTTITLDEARLYHLVHFKKGRQDAVLRLEFQSGGTKIYAFTFG